MMASPAGRRRPAALPERGESRRGRRSPARGRSRWGPFQQVVNELQSRPAPAHMLEGGPRLRPEILARWQGPGGEVSPAPRRAQGASTPPSALLADVEPPSWSRHRGGGTRRRWRSCSTNLPAGGYDAGSRGPRPALRAESRAACRHHGVSPREVIPARAGHPPAPRAPPRRIRKGPRGGAKNAGSETRWARTTKGEVLARHLRAPTGARRAVRA